MSNVSIELMNEAIALFMGYRIYDWGLTRCVVVNESKDSIAVSKLDYHINWSTLMPVVSKIETIANGRERRWVMDSFWACLGIGGGLFLIFAGLALFYWVVDRCDRD